MRYNRPLKLPIVGGIQAFDQENVAYGFDNRNTGTVTRGFDYITDNIRNEEGPRFDNMCIWSDNSGRAYATQRPAIKAQDITAKTGFSALGRGIHRIPGMPGIEIHIVEDELFSRTSYLSGVQETVDSADVDSVAFPGGIEKVYFDRIDEYTLGIVTPFTEVPGVSNLFNDINNDNEFHTLSMDSDGDNLVLTDRTSALPAGVELGKGFVFLNGKGYILDRPTGRIYNSSDATLTTWNALDFLTGERYYDRGVQIMRHHDDIVQFNERSIEFFYDAANASGSPLRRRQDIFYSIGIIGEAVAVEDTIYFVGVSEGNDYGIYALKNHAIKKISDERVNQQIHVMAAGGTPLQLAAFTMWSRHFISIVQNDWSVTYIASVASVASLDVVDNVIYDTKYNALYSWTSTDAALNPIIIDADIGAGLLTRQGNIISFNTVISSTVEDDASEAADSDGIPTSPIPITASITSPNLVLGNSFLKRWQQLDIEGSHGKRQDSADAIDLTLSWSDDFYETFSTGRTVNYENGRFQQRALGQSRQRVWKLETSTNTRLFLENWIIRYSEGTH